MRKPVLIVGHSPNKSNAPALSPAPGNTAGRRLFEMSGWSMEDWELYCERVNLLKKPDAKDGRQAADWLVTIGQLSARHVIFVGRETERYFPWNSGKWGEWVTVRHLHSRWTWIPHTSGLTRHWNDAGEKFRLRELFAHLLRQVEQESESYR